MGNKLETKKKQAEMAIKNLRNAWYRAATLPIREAMALVNEATEAYKQAILSYGLEKLRTSDASELKSKE